MSGYTTWASVSALRSWERIQEEIRTIRIVYDAKLETVGDLRERERLATECSDRVQPLIESAHVLYARYARHIS